MLLKKLIKNCPKNFKNLKIKGLSQDSRSLKKGDLFFAIKGEKFNGEKFIKEAGTILWNGPVGVFEEEMFENGTKDIAYSIKETKALTIAGGGDTISAIEKFINFEDLDYISTGGGAFLEFLEGNELPGIKIIKKL